MRRRLRFISLPAAAALLISTAWITARQDGPKNLQVFPKDSTRADIIPHMRNFSFALGVPCTYCHGTEEQTTSNLEGVDFSLDIKPTKTKARAMIRMMNQINSSLLSAVPHRSDRNLEVTCFTCHSGIPLPEKIEQRVARIAAADGVEAAVADYRETRERYYGGAAYNFGQQPLVELATTLHEAGDHAAAAAISQLNLEFHPESTQSMYRLAEAYFEMGEMEKAKPLYEEVQKRWSWHQGVPQRLEAIGTPH